MMASLLRADDIAIGIAPPRHHPRRQAKCTPRPGGRGVVCTLSETKKRRLGLAPLIGFAGGGVADTLDYGRSVRIELLGPLDGFLLRGQHVTGAVRFCLPDGVIALRPSL